MCFGLGDNRQPSFLTIRLLKIMLTGKQNLFGWFGNECSYDISTELMIHRLSNIKQFGSVTELENVLKRFAA